MADEIKPEATIEVELPLAKNEVAFILGFLTALPIASVPSKEVAAMVWGLREKFEAAMKGFPEVKK